MAEHLNTIPVIRRTGASLDSMRRLARLDGATHELVLGPLLVTFYRTTDAGGFEQATASCDGAEWALSGWVHRSVPRLPATATTLA
jgi:hypothetical protein